MRNTRFKKRIISFLLALTMLFSSVSTDLHITRASVPTPQVQSAEEESCTLYANDLNLTAVKNGAAIDFSGGARIDYGTTLSFVAKKTDNNEVSGLVVFYGTNNDTLVDNNGDVVIEYLKKYSTGDVLPVGDYYIFYDSDEFASLGLSGVVEYALRVEQKKIASPSNLSWGTGENAMKASWYPVTTDVDGQNLIGEDTTVSYRVSLYYGTETQPIYTSDVLTATSIDLKDEITKAQAEGGKGYGDYTFKVEAIPANVNYASASATVAQAYTYKDTVKPEITSYQVIVEEGEKTLQAHAVDTGIGIRYYAFAPSSVLESSIEWQTLEDAVAGEEGYTAKAKVSDIGQGTIYFYAKDEHGNVTCQKVAKTDNTDGDAIVISKVTLKNYYSANVASDPVTYLVGNEGFTLPVASEMVRTGYTFTGWYDAETEGTVYTAVTPGEATGILLAGSECTLYGRWKTQTVSFSVQPDNVTKVYDGNTSTLTATLADSVSYDSVSWQWYYMADTDVPPETLDGATGSGRSTSLSVCNVKDRGYYYAVATIKVNGMEDVTVTSDTAQVSIEKRPLKIRIQNKQVTYLDEVPNDFSFQLDVNGENEGLAGEDKLDSLFATEKANIETTYEKGSGVKEDGYPIIYNGTITKENYYVTLADGKLTVLQMNLADSENVTVTLSKDSYVYDGDEKKPKVESVTLQQGEQTVLLEEGADKDYTYGYRNNKKANQTGEDGTAVIITFCGNYTGTIEKPFTITKGEYEVQTVMSGWKYGETAQTPGVDKLQEGTANYYYLEVAKTEGEYLSILDAKNAFENNTVDKTSATTTKPVNAGRYYVWAEISETDNYNEIIAKPAVFDIQPREIVITASSHEWAFDENEHADSSCTITGDGFVGQDDFQWYTATGSIREIGEVANVVTYKLTSATLSRNYQITAIDGILSVTATKLVPPSTFNWSSTPGTVSWIAITKDNLDVQYELKLYRTQLNEDGTVKKDTYGNILYDEEPVKTYLTENGETSHSFLQDILDDCATNQKLYGYTATIQVFPQYGENEKHNYEKSDPSSKLDPRYTAKLTLHTTNGVGSCYVVDPEDADNQTMQSVILFQGQSVNMKMTSQEGYSASYWYINSEASAYANIQSNLSSATLKLLTTGMTNPEEIQVSPVASDHSPIIANVSSTMNGNHTKVQVAMSFEDTIGLDSYALIRLEQPLADGEGLTIDSSDWKEIPKDANGKNQKSYVAYEDITENGFYYVCIRDTGGNARFRSTPVTVYKIAFDKGVEEEEAGNVTGEMSAILKLKDEPVELPTNAFVRAGYGFTNWTGSTGIYAINGTYVANASDTLVAGWTDAKVSYKVRYFYQNLTESVDVNGNAQVTVSYVESEDAATSFTVEYGKEVSYNNAEIQAGKTGYTLTRTPDGISDYDTTYRIIEDNQEICLYYNLDKYTITYTYTDTEAQVNTDIQTYYYGQTVQELVKPKAVGYTFVGWNWGDAGQAPATMPNNNLKVTGSFKAEQVKYYIVYYMQDLDQSVENEGNNFLAKSFYKNDTLTEEINASYGEKLLATVRTPDLVPEGTTSVVARSLTGFTPVAVQVSYSNPVTTDSDSAFDALVNGTHIEANGTVQKALTDEELEEVTGYQNGPTYICFYYKRNIHTLTMDVYKDARENNVHLFGSYFDGTDEKDNDNASWVLPYGYQFTSEDTTLVGDGSDGSYKASYFETYGYLPLETDGTHSVNWTKRWPTGENVTSKDKYYLADFVDWSCGERPTSMPDGDVSITREYASKELAKYNIEVYIETVTDVEENVTLDDGTPKKVFLKKAQGTYDKAITYERYGEVGQTVKIVDTMPADSDKQDDYIYITVDELAKGVTNYKLYEHNPENDLCNVQNNESHELLESTITENVIENNVYTNVTTLRLNLVRKEHTSVVRYHEIKDSVNNIFAYRIIKQKWGTNYLVDPLYYFDGKTTANENGTIVSEKETIAETNFRNGNYVVSYTGYYWLPNSGHGPSKQYVNYTELNEAPALLMTVGTTGDGTEPTSIDPIASSNQSRSYMDVYYSAQEMDKHYYLKLTYETKNSGSTKMMISEVEYPVLANAVTDDKTEYQVCVVNKCDVFQTSGTTVGTGEEGYPGSKYLSTNSVSGFQYTYATDAEGKEILREGFFPVTLTYDAYENKGASNPDGTHVTGTATFYLYVVDGKSDGNLYAIDARNQFYNGNRISFSYNNLSSYETAHVGRDYFMAESNRPTNGRVEERANSTAALYSDGKTLEEAGSITNLMTHDFLAYYYDVYNDYYITFHYDGQSCSGSPHDNYSYNQEITDFTCNTFSVPEGYHIAWYMDADYTTPVHAFNITGPINIYGRREKNPVENWDYAFYKLAETYEGTQWITLDNLSTFQWQDRTQFSGSSLTPETVNNEAQIVGENCETITKSVNVDYVNEMGITTTMAGLRTEWYINGQLVMAKQPNFSMTFIEFYMDPSKYAREGFTYDSTNVKNKSKAFCTTTPVNMYAYFTRTSHTLTVSRRNAKIDNDEVSTKVYGEIIRLEDPTKEGYEFDGWKLQKVTVNGDVTTYTDLDAEQYHYVHVEADGETPGYATFRMPSCDTIAIAQWKPIEVEFEIIHYLQDDNKTYNPELLETVREMTGTSVDVILNGENVSATLYQYGGNVKAISYTNNGLTYYYAGMDTPAESERYEIETADAFAVVQKVSGCKSEDTPDVSTYTLTDLGSMFSLTFVKYEYDTEQLTLSESDTFTVHHDMLLSYYYERSSSIQIRTIALSSDAGDTGLTISGAGNHYYGEKFSLYAVIQPNGYTFLGWFNAKDVLKDYPTDGSRPESLSGMVLADDAIAKITAGTIVPVCPELSFSMVAKETADYVAITVVTDVAKPTVTVKSTRVLTQEEANAANEGKTEDKWVQPNPYYYQYEADASNVLTATVNWGEAGAAGSSVKGYKWYCKYYAPETTVPDENEILTSDMEEIPNSNSGTYLFPTGKDAGTYVYRCVVEAERKDNGRTSSVEGTYTLKVYPCETYYRTIPVNVKYDGTTHAYTEYFSYGTGSNAGIRGYYSKTAIPADISAEELTRRMELLDDNAEKIFDSCAKVTFSDVKVAVDEEHTVISNVAYYYIQSADSNYASVTGSEEILIQPVEVSVSAKKPFTKIYDGTEDVQGSYNLPDEEKSDFHRLMTGSDLENGQMYYEISGILPCDQDKQLRLNFTAKFDSKHVLNATTVTLENMWVAQTDLNQVMNNYNYRFPENATLQLSGQIKPYPLSVKWIPTQTSDATATYTADSFKYNYDGTEKHPYVVITESNPPDDKNTIILKVGNVQKNVGIYEATVEVSASEDADYAPSDYTFTLTKQTYEITSRYIKVCPKNVTKVYNGNEQTMVKNELVNEFRFFTKEKADDEWTEYESLPTGETFAVFTDKTGKNVGTYTITAKDIVILNSQNKNINDNYQIEYGSGVLTIIPCPVVVSGIGAEDKNYDKTVSVTLNFDNVAFSRLETVYNETTKTYDIKKEDNQAVTMPGLYAGDVLTLDTTKVTGAFEDAKAGNDKTVNLTIDNSSAKADGSAGALQDVSKENYRLVTEESQKTTTASILAGTLLTVSVDDYSYVYGEQPLYSDYTLLYTGFMEGDSALNSVQNKATFIIKKLEGETYQEVAIDGTATDMKALPAGEYYIFLKENTDGTVTGLQSDDYTIKWDGVPAKLTVTKRPVRIVAKTGETASVILKTYDNTTDVLTDAKDSISANAGNTYYTFEPTLNSENQEIAESGIVNNDDVKLGSYTAVYDSKNVKTATTVNITNVVLSGEKAANYELANTSFELKGEITAKDLTITIDDAVTVYGNPAPEYTYTLTGVVESEKTEIVAAVKAAMHPICAYTNTAGSPNRVVGTYAINADATDNYQNTNCYQNENYTITYTSGNLTVNRRTVFYKADDKNMIYQKDNLPTFTGAFMSDNDQVDDDGWVYGENVSNVDVASFVQLYTDEACSEENKVTDNNYAFEFKCWENAEQTAEVSPTTPAGAYDIDPVNVEGQLFAKNYEFKKENGTLTINKYYLRVYNVEVLGKIYDGTTTVDENHLLIANGTYGNFDYKGIMFTYYKSGSLDETKFYTNMTDDEKNSLDISAKYQSAGVGDNKLVDVTIKLKTDSYLDKRYILLTDETLEEAKIALGRRDISEVTQTKATAFVIGANGQRIETAIQPRPLTLYPVDATILYGETLTITGDAGMAEELNYSVIVDKKPAIGATGNEAAIGFVEGEGLSDIGFNLNYSIYATDLDGDGRPNSDSGTSYTAGSDVGNYAINISSSQPQGTSGNYDVSYEKGLLIVTQNQFPAPTVAWSATNIGTINWTQVSKIGNVDVQGYEISLYKDGDVVSFNTGEGTAESITVSNTTTSYDFASYMHESAGAYTVKVHAIASTDNNAGYKNVKQVGADGTSVQKYAANVTVKFDETAGSDTVAATAKTKVATINATDSTSYIMIAGEKDVSVAYEWGRLGADNGSTTEYRTGYEIDTCTVSSGLTLGTATDDSESGSYLNTVSLADNHAGASDLSVTLKLKVREATLTATITEATGLDKIMYGYSRGALLYTVNAVHSDLIDTDYVYTYSWSIKRGTKVFNATNVPTDVDANSVAWNEKTFSMPEGFGVYNGDYVIQCTITATRKDNGEETGVNSTKTLRINKAVLNASAINVTVADWTYGEDRTGKITAAKVYSGIGDLTSYYKKATEENAEWTQELPTDVGSYQVKYVSATNDNYESVTSDIKTFTISQATLAMPANLSMTSSSTAPYGLVKWNAVEGPKENAGAEGDSKSYIDVQYKVTLKYKAPDAAIDSEPTQLGDTVTTSETQYDFTERISQKGTYYVYVQAVVKPRMNQDFSEQDTTNCANSDVAVYSAFITIGAEISSNGEDTTNQIGFTKEYDGNDGLKMTVTYSDSSENVQYQWYKNGNNPIEGATENTYTIYYVEENANYVCKITMDGGNSVYTKSVYAAITPRPVTIKTNSKEKVYDGTALTDTTTTLSYTGDSTKTALGFGDTMTCTVAGSATYVADTSTKNNTYNNLVIKQGDKVVYEKTGTNNNYVLTEDLGTLTITKRPITIMADSTIENEWIYDESTHTKNSYTYTPYSTNPAQGLADGDLIASVTITGEITDVGTVANIPKDCVIKKGNAQTGNDVTANYNINYVNGTLEVTQADASIALSGNMDKVYDGRAVTDPTQETVGNGIGTSTGAVYTKTGDGAVSFKYYTKNEDNTYTELSGAPKDAGTYYVKAFTAETQNYKAAQSDYLQFAISKREVTLTATDKSSVYGQDIVTLTYTQTSNLKILENELSGFDIQLRTDATNESPVGDSYPITISYVTNNNYTITTIPGKYKIMNAEMSVTAEGVDTVYDGEQHGITVTATANAVSGDQTKIKIYYSDTTELTAENYQIAGSTTVKKYKDVKMDGSTVGSYTVYYYVACENYNGKAGNKTVQIQPREVSLKVENKSSKFGETIKELTYQQTSAFGVIAADEATLAITPVVKNSEGTIITLSSSSPVGSYPITLDINTSDNYRFTVTDGTYIISDASLTVTANDIIHVYDGNEYGILVTVSATAVEGDTPVIYYSETELDDNNYQIDGVTEKLTYTDVKLNGNSVESYTVYYYVTCQNYTPVTGSKTVTITKRPIHVQAGNESRAYNGSPLTFIGRTLDTTLYSLADETSLAEGDVITELSFTGTITNVGEVDNIPSACKIENQTAQNETNQTNKDVTANYNITYVNGTLEVTHADASIELSGNMDKIYDGQAVTTPTQATVGNGTGTSRGVVYTKTGDGAVSFKYYTKNADNTYSELSGAPKDAGTYYLKAFTEETQNYKAAQSDYLQFTISKREVTLTATDKSSVYGQDIATLEYTQSSITKIVPADLAGFNILLSTSATSTKSAGTYPITISFIQNNNYTIVTVDGTYTISNAQLSVQAEGITTEYDGNAYGITVTVEANAVFGDADNIEIYYGTTELTAENYQSAGSTENLKYTYVKRDGTDVSDYMVYYYVVCDSYDSVTGSAKVRITPRALTILADSAYAEYNPSHPLTKNSYTFADGTSLLTGDKITDITITGSQDIKGSSLNEPSNAVIHNQNGAGDDVTGCYEIMYQPGTLAVDITMQEITAQDLTLVYDGAIHDMLEVEASTTGDSTLVYTATLDGVDAQGIQEPGTLYITITAPETNRYAVAVKHVKLIITRREITVAADSDSKEYDGTALTKHTYTITEGSLAQTDAAMVTYNEDSTITYVGEIENVVDTVSIMREDVDVTDNYIITTENGTLTIKKRNLTIRAKDKEKTYDGTPLTYEEQPLEDAMYDITDGSLVQGDTIVSLDFAGRVVNAETVENIVSQAVIVNELNENVTEYYDISYENGTLTVNRKDAKIDLTGKMDKTYDGMFVNDPVPEEVHPAENVAYFTKSGDGEVSFKYYTKVGDTYTELKAGAPKTAGTYYVKAFTRQTVNYEAAESDYLKFTIAKKKLEITAMSEHKVYDGKPLTFVGRDFDDALYSVTAGSLVSKDVICNLTFEGSITDAGTTANVVRNAVIKDEDGVDVSESYDISYISGELTVEQAPKPEESDKPDTTPDNMQDDIPDTIPVQEEIIVPGDKPGSLIVSTDSTDRDNENHIDKMKHFNVFLPDKEVVAREVLSDEEWKLLENGGNIEIRLMINRIADKTVSDDLAVALQKLLEKLKNDSMGELSEAETGKTVFLKAYLDLSLEKKVLSENWERIYQTENNVPVTIQIPEEFLVAGEILYLMRQDKDGFVVLEDMDSEPDTITFLTNDFDAVYALVAVVDELVATDTDFVSDEEYLDEEYPDKEHTDCFWHFIILLMLLLSVSVTIVYWKKEDEDEETDNEERQKDDGETTENVSDKPRKVRRKGYGILIVVFNGIGIICVILGSCKWDLPLEIISIILTAAMDGMKTIKNRNKITKQKNKTK